MKKIITMLFVLAVLCVAIPVNTISANSISSDEEKISMLKKEINKAYEKADQLKNNTEYKEAKGVFGSMYSTRINRLSKLFGVSARDVEKQLKAIVESDEEIGDVVMDMLNVDALTSATLFIYLMFSFEDASVSHTDREIYKCMMNSDAVFKALGMVIKTADEASEEEFDTKMTTTVLRIYPMFMDEYNKCTDDTGCKLEDTRNNLKTAAKNPAKGVSSNEQTATDALKDNIKKIYKELNITHTNAEIEAIIDDGLHFAARTSNEDIFQILADLDKFTEASDKEEYIDKYFDKFLVMFYYSLTSFLSADTDLIKPYENKEKYIDILCALLQSDVIHKTRSKMQDAIATKNKLTVFFTMGSLLDALYSEEERTMGIEGSCTTEEYAEMLLTNSYGFKHYDINNYSAEIDKEENGGYLSVSTTAMEGSMVSMTANVESGYGLENVYYVDSTGQHRIDDLGTGIYKFIMPKGEVKVFANFIDEIDEVTSRTTQFTVKTEYIDKATYDADKSSLLGDINTLITSPTNGTYVIAAQYGSKYAGFYYNGSEWTDVEFNTTQEAINLSSNSKVYVLGQIYIEPIADDFVFTSPKNRAANGSVKTAKVEAIEEKGRYIKVRYFNEKGDEVDAPSLPGTYTVKIDVDAGLKYLQKEGITDKTWKFRIVEYSVVNTCTK